MIADDTQVSLQSLMVTLASICFHVVLQFVSSRYGSRRAGRFAHLLRRWSNL